MTYLRQRSAPGRRRIGAAAAAVAALVLAVALVQWRAPRFFPAIASAVADPFWRVRFAFQNGALESPDELLAENASLKLQVAALDGRLASSTAALLEAENADLLGLLGRATTTRSAYTAAAVLARPPFSPYDRLILDLGSDDGVSTTTLVYAPGGALIGRVTGALGHTSVATLFSSPGQSYPVLIGPQSLPATAVGKGGGHYSAQVPHGSGIAPGDAVSDSSLHDRAFGTVVSVTTDPSDPFDSVLFALPADPYGLRWVLLDISKP
ncbi:MAG: rod shape-determining protein MreC [Patescibacteria group bacterium]|nr:rod shape-determining protein MreC [Patescibacteria group bacterium]